MKILWALFFLTLSSCVTQSVRDADLQSWIGESTQTLETHSVFSALPREERRIPDSDEKLINYRQRKTVEVEPRTCYGAGGGIQNFGLGATHCSPRQVEQVICVHQFKVKEDVVESYRVLGEDCYTDCKFRPKGSCPEDMKK